MYPDLHPPRLQWLEQKECCYSMVANTQLCTVQRLMLLAAGWFQVAGGCSPAASLFGPSAGATADRLSLTADLMWQLQLWERS